uniref:Choline transporter-like protein n=1 Tax=Globisporangium ultimum (strain ATCC 200006 / CBS 805.95 / DAOM BR144) TaxID=431595 RepID=K3WN71_GLOUD
MGNRCCKRSDANADTAAGANPFKPDNRKCTDILFFLLFILFWVGMIIIAAVGYQNGEPKRLIYGTDWMGRTCGVKADASGSIPAYDLTDYKYLIYPRLGEDLLALELQSGGVSSISLTDTSALKKFYGVCVPKCPMTNDSITGVYVHAYKDYNVHTDPVNALDTSLGATIEDESAGSPWKLMMDTTEVLYRCMELSKIEVSMLARCADDCAPDEEAYYQREGITARTCGTSYTLNPLIDCKEQDCTDVVLAARANCTSIESKKQERQVTAARQDPVNELLSRKWYMVARWIGDIEKAAFPILLCGGVFAMMLGFFWLVMLRYCAGLFVWLVIIFMCAMQVVITVFCAFEGGILTDTRMTEAMARMGVSDSTTSSLMASSTTYINSSGFKVSEDQVYYWAIACYVMIACDVLLLLVLIFMCSRIRIAIGIIREASKALQSMPMLALYPLVPTVFALGLFAYWLVAAAYIATSAEITLQDVSTAAANVTGYTPIAAVVNNDNVVNYLLLYHLFGLLWTNQFIQATAYTTIAGAFCEYYWTLDKRQVRSLPVLRSWWRTIRYHFGSMAFGSLIIAIVQFFRIALEYLDQKMRTAKQGNTVVKVVMMCMKCCLWCFEKILKFLNKNAFIIIAMKGCSFCPAMKDSFSLLVANAARVATVSIISGLLMVLGKVFIACFSMFFMFLFIRHPPSQLPGFLVGDLEHITSPIFPMLVTGLLGYATASFFLDVYGTGIDTILLCFCEDCNVNKGSDTYYMSDELFAYIEGPAKKNALRAFQPPTRDVSARAMGEGATPTAGAPVFQPSSSPMQKRF